jgi:hypothetical protein
MRSSPLSLIAISAYCFYALLLPLWGAVPGNLVSVTGFEPLYWLDYPPFWAFIALCGGIIFLVCTRKENPAWYLGIPLVAVLAFIAFSPVFFELFPLRDPSPAFYDPLHIMALVSAYGSFLLPPCIALFFWSQSGLGKWRAVIVAIALIFTLNAMAFFFSFFSSYLVAYGLLSPSPPVFIDGHPVKSDGEGLLFLFIHLIIGLPVLGVCFLALAVITWNASRMAVPAGSRSEEGRNESP